MRNDNLLTDKWHVLKVKGGRAVERGDGGRRVGQHSPVQEVPDGDGQDGQQLEFDVRFPATKKIQFQIMFLLMMIGMQIEKTGVNFINILHTHIFHTKAN